MYDRAPRILVATAPTNNTPPKIGPGVYWNDSGEVKIGELNRNAHIDPLMLFAIIWIIITCYWMGVAI